MILRAEHNSDYLVVSNAVLRDTRLSLAAKGVLLMMLANSNDWNFNTKWIEQTARVSHGTALKLLHELEEAGYVIVPKVRSRNEGGKFTNGEWIIRETPVVQNLNYGSENDAVQNLNHGEPTTVQNLNHGEPTTVQNLNHERGTKFEPIINTIDNNYHGVEIPNNNNAVQNLNCGDAPTVQDLNRGEKKKRKKPTEREAVIQLLQERAGEDKELMELFGEWLNNRKAKRAPETVCAIKRNLNKLDEFAAQSNMTVNAYMSEVVRRGWQGFFVIHNYSKPVPQGQKADSGTSYLEKLLGGNE